MTNSPKYEIDKDLVLTRVIPYHGNKDIDIPRGNFQVESSWNRLTCHPVAFPAIAATKASQADVWVDAVADVKGPDHTRPN